MSDIRRLLESLDKLTEQAASSNVVQLPLGAPKGVPAGTQAFGQMGQVLTKPKQDDAGNKPAAVPKSAAPVPGQKSLPGFGITHLEPETPAYTPKQPWLDPKGSKEPAYMRKAAGITAPEPLGVIGGTGPDAKFAKAAPPAANEPIIPKQSPKLAYSAPRIKVGTGSEYSNVYSAPKGAEGKPTFADTQYARDVAAQLKKFPDDPNLRAEYDSLQQRGLTPAPTPNATPLTQAQLDAINYNDRAAAAAAAGQKPETSQAPGRPGQLAVPDISAATREPTYYQLPSGDWIERLHRVTPGGIPGAIKEYAAKKVAEDFENFLDINFPIISKPLKEQTKIGGLKPTEVVPWEGGGGGAAVGGGPRVTPGPVPRVPANVEVPTYQRKGQPSAMPQGAEVPPSPKPRLKVTSEPKQVGPSSAASNEPTVSQPKVFKTHPERVQAQAARRDQELMQTKPGEFPPIGPGATPKVIEPLPPGMEGPKKMWSPAAVPVGALPAAGGGGKEGTGTESPSSSDTAEPTITTKPVEIWRSEDLPNSNERPADIGIVPPATPASSAPAAPVKQEPKPVEPKKDANKEPQVSKPVEPKEPKKDISSGAGGGEGGGQGTGVGTGTGAGTMPVDSSDWIERLHKVTPGGIPGAVKEFKEFLNAFKVPFDKRKIK